MLSITLFRTASQERNMRSAPEDGAAPVLKRCLALCGRRASWAANGVGRWHRANASHKATTNWAKLRHTLQRLVGSPCPCWHSTMPSLGQTSQPSNLRSRPRNHMALKRSRTHRPGLRNLSHAPYNTTPSSPQTILPASSRSRLHNCRGPLGVVAQSADHKCDDGNNTTSAWPRPSLGTVPPHNCTDQQVQVLLWAVGGQVRVA